MLMGVDVANIAVIVLAVLFVAEENRTRLVEVSVALTPRRHNLVLAKAPRPGSEWGPQPLTYGT
jgi:hypothetical protein